MIVLLSVGIFVQGTSVRRVRVRAYKRVRNGSLYRNTGPDWVFRAGDLVVAYGDKGQMAALRRLLGVAAR